MELRLSNFFEIRSTPPGEKKTKNNDLLIEEMTVLDLLPFSSVPKIQFPKIVFGKSTAIRKILLRNPSSKSLQIELIKLPKSESGFEVEYDKFSLGSQEEMTLAIGWSPLAPGSIRDSITLKYGIFKTIIYLSGSTKEENERKVKPLLNPPTSKSKAKKKILSSLPNPVTRKNVYTPSLTKLECDKENENPVTWSPQPIQFVDSSLKDFSKWNIEPITAPESSLNLRRETFVTNSKALEETFEIFKSNESNDKREKEEKENEKYKNEKYKNENEKEKEDSIELFNEKDFSKMKNSRIDFEILETSLLSSEDRRGTYCLPSAPTLYIPDISDLDLELSPNKVCNLNDLDSLNLLKSLDYNSPFSSSSSSTHNLNHEDLDEVSLLIANHLNNNKNNNNQFYINNNNQEEEDGEEENTTNLKFTSNLNHDDSFSLDETKYDYNEDTVYETNIHECKKSFLSTTISENNFIPPPDLGYCSTTLKNPLKAEDESEDRLQEKSILSVCRTLFESPGKESSSLTYVKDDTGTGNKLSPIIEMEEVSWRCRRSASSKSLSTSAKGSFKKPLSKILPLKRRSLSLLKPKARKETRRHTLLKMSIEPNIVRHPNLFAAQNMYYDERWLSKQESGFSKWLNFILTPPDDMVAKSTIDVGKLWAACSKDVKVPRAPTRELMSIRVYTAHRDMNALRRAACHLWQSKEIAGVIAKLENEIEKKRILIRSDRPLHKDIGLKRQFLMLLLNYNPLWLRIGLETIYGEVLPISNNVDVVGISRFIILRLLSNPDILEDYSHSTVPHLYKAGHEGALQKFTLKKFLQFVYFVDVAKAKRLIRHNPCLFVKDSDVKSSREILIEFSKDYLSGEGDIIKHLKYFGFEVIHKQTPLDEFDFGVSNIATDLRDGVRLCKVLEFLKEKDFSSKLRLPAVSLLQKVHNVNIALSYLKGEAGVGIPKDIEAKDIVNGHKEKTISLLSHLIFTLGLSSLLPVETLQKEISFCKKSLFVKALTHKEAALIVSAFSSSSSSQNSFSSFPVSYSESIETMSYQTTLLLEWSQLICAHYGLHIHNFTVSFSDGRALCLLLHHYYPEYLSRSDIENQTTVSAMGDEANDELTTTKLSKKENETLLLNEKKNFKLFKDTLSDIGGVPLLIKSSDMSNTIPDQKVTITFLTYLCSRLITLSKETSAARTIQLSWRRFKALRDAEILLTKEKSALQIQRWYRKLMRKRFLKKREFATRLLQKTWRGYLGRKIAFDLRFSLYLKKIVLCQSTLRGFLCRRRVQCLKTQIASVIIIQSHFKRWKASRHFTKLIYVCLFIQRRWRALRERHNYLVIRKSIIRIQSVIKGRRIRRDFLRRKKAASLLQFHFKVCLQKRQNELHQRQNTAAFLIQNWMRAQLVKRKSLEDLAAKKRAVICIQSYMRRYTQIKKYRLIKSSVCLLQNWMRSIKMTIRLRTEYIIRRQSVLLLQSYTRRYLTQKKYLNLQKVTIILQSHTRRYLAEKKYLNLRKNTIILQSHTRKYLAHKKYQDLKEKTIIVQSYFRKYLAEKNYQNLRKNTIILQSHIRRYLSHQRYRKLRQNVIFLQKQFRIILTMRQNYNSSHILHRNKGGYLFKSFLRFKNSIIYLQRLWRHKEKTKRERDEMAAKVIQTWFRTHQIRNHFLKMKKAAVSLQVAFRERRASHIQSLCRLAILKIYTVSQIGKYMSAIVTIQSFVRGWIARNKYQKALSKESSSKYDELATKDEIAAALCIQSAFRSYLLRRALKCKYKAIVRIQSFWRGYRIRSRILDEKNSRLSSLRARLAVARNEVTEDKKLGNRILDAIDYLYSLTDLADMIRVCRDLDVSTRYSSLCCEYMLHQNGRPISILLDLVSRCNRSLPHMEVISAIFDVFLNLVRYESSRHSFATLSESFNLILGVISKFKDNSHDILVKGLSLFYLLTNESLSLSHLRSQVKRFESLLSLHERKERLGEKGRKKTFRKKSKDIALGLQWNTSENYSRYFENPVLALKSLLQKLK